MPLPDLIPDLEAALREFEETGGPEIKHLCWILDDLAKTLLAAGRPDLVEVPRAILVEINDLYQGWVPSMFTPEKPIRASWPTWRVSLVWYSLAAIDEAMARGEMERAAIRRLLPFLKPKLPEVTTERLANWRHEMQRKSGSPRLPGALVRRYRRGLPPTAGDTPDARLAWCIGMIERPIFRGQHPRN
jgi:hypothetical protein